MHEQTCNTHDGCDNDIHTSIDGHKHVTMSAVLPVVCTNLSSVKQQQNKSVA